MSTGKPPFTSSTYYAGKDNHMLELEVNYKSNKGYYQVLSYTLKEDGMFKSSSKNKLGLELWTEALARGFYLPLKPGEIPRILIIGGADQFLSNYIHETRDANITIVDPMHELYSSTTFKSVLGLKDESFVGDKRLCFVESTFQEAYDDMVFNDEEFHMILVYGAKDTFDHKTGMYDVQLVPKLKSILKPEGFLLVHQNYTVKKPAREARLSDDPEYIEKVRTDTKYYKAYEEAMEREFCQTDYLFKASMKIGVFLKDNVDAKLSRYSV